MLSNRENKQIRKKFTPGAIVGASWQSTLLHNNGYEKSNLMQLSLTFITQRPAMHFSQRSRAKTQVAGAFKEEKRSREDRGLFFFFFSTFCAFLFLWL